MKKTTSIITFGIILALLALWGVSSTQKASLGSIIQSQEYYATSTAANAVYGGFSSSKAIKAGRGSFGSLIITGANTGIVNFYNATTSDVNLRTGQRASSTILIASIPASMAAGTYVFDSEFSDGLYMSLDSGNMPTTTITYR